MGRLRRLLAAGTCKPSLLRRLSLGSRSRQHIPEMPGLPSCAEMRRQPGRVGSTNPTSSPRRRSEFLRTEEAIAIRILAAEHGGQRLAMFGKADRPALA